MPPDTTPTVAIAPPADVGAFANRLLALTAEPLPRADFVGRLAAMVADAVAGSPLELWIDDGPWWFQGHVDRRRAAVVQRVVPIAPRLTLDALCAAVSVEPTGRESGRVIARRKPDGTHDVTIVDLAVGDTRAGWVVVDHGVADYLARRDVALLGRIAEPLATSAMTQRVQALLRERVKELSCLYAVAQITRSSGHRLPELLESVARQLPEAWQYPEIAASRIELDGEAFGQQAPEGGWVAEQRAELVVDGARRGMVAIGYRDTRPELDEGPFLTEERALLEAVASQIAATVSRKEAELEQERLRDHLRHADRLATVGELAAGVAHELNEPISAVLGFAQLLRGQRNPEDSDWEDLGKIEAAALHARDIVRQLLLFSRRGPVAREEVDLERVIDDAAVIVGPRLRRAGVRMHRERTAPARIAGDSAQLRQVVVNLLVNAIQAMPEGGDVTVRIDADAGDRVLTVEDTGDGMSDGVRQQALLPFFTTRELHEGTGLGLAVVHGIVTGHGGTVEIDSREGIGTRVVLRLPVTADEEGDR